MNYVLERNRNSFSINDAWNQYCNCECRMLEVREKKEKKNAEEVHTIVNKPVT